MRFAHSRFYKSRPAVKGEAYDRVVTTAWTFEPDVSILTYAATVYRDTGDCWCKRDHISTARERFEKNPIRVRLQSKGQVQELDNIAMDWYIATKLLFRFGTHNVNEVDVRRIHGDVVIPQNFNQEYSYLDEYYEYSKYQDLGPNQTDFHHYLMGLAIPTLYLAYTYMI